MPTFGGIGFGGGAITPGNFTNSATGTYSSGGINYKYVTFTGAATLNVNRAGFFDILVIGGGGGGGASDGAGGGGAGGLHYLTNVYIATGNYTAIIGSGGPSATNGNPSQLAGMIALGGGFGGNAGNGGSGGSGGGAGGATTPGVAQLSQGNNGGNGDYAGRTAGGGGGGAGSVGGNSNTGANLGGNGGRRSKFIYF